METRTEGCSVTRAGFDPNVLISARISSKGAPRELLHRWIAGDFEMVASPEVLFELQEVLIRPKFRRYLSYADALEYVLWIHDMADVSEEVRPDVLQGAVPTDPDDD